MTKDIENKSVWWREPMVWLILMLPLLAVVAGLTTVWIAYKKADIVLNDADSPNLEITKADQMDKKATLMALTADMRVGYGGMLAITLNGKLSKKPYYLLLKLVPANTGSSSNIILTLRPDSTGAYTTTLPSMLAGERRVLLEPEDSKWRLKGTWQAPFSGTLQLAARSISDSTMLP
jgi:hypothetical protein